MWLLFTTCYFSWGPKWWARSSWEWAAAASQTSSRVALKQNREGGSCRWNHEPHLPVPIFGEHCWPTALFPGQQPTVTRLPQNLCQGSDWKCFIWEMPENTHRGVRKRDKEGEEHVTKPVLAAGKWRLSPPSELGISHPQEGWGHQGNYKQTPINYIDWGLFPGFFFLIGIYLICNTVNFRCTAY